VVGHWPHHPKVEGSSPAAGPRRKTISIEKVRRMMPKVTAELLATLLIFPMFIFLVVQLTWEAKDDKRKKYRHDASQRRAVDHSPHHPKVDF
jgi:hypothetical protein